jgi:hypothetical protein
MKQPEVSEAATEVEGLGPIKVVSEIVQGIGIALGLSLLWVLEVCRDGVFRLLDRANLRPRSRPASPFPPGQPRKRTPRRAH